MLTNQSGDHGYTISPTPEDLATLSKTKAGESIMPGLPLHPSQKKLPKAAGSKWVLLLLRCQRAPSTAQALKPIEFDCPPGHARSRAGGSIGRLAQRNRPSRIKQGGVAQGSRGILALQLSLSAMSLRASSKSIRALWPCFSSRCRRWPPPKRTNGFPAANACASGP